MATSTAVISTVAVAGADVSVGVVAVAAAPAAESVCAVSDFLQANAESTSAIVRIDVLFMCRDLRIRPPDWGVSLERLTSSQDSYAKCRTRPEKLPVAGSAPPRFLRGAARLHLTPAT